jgi:hypothetical protein
VSLGKSQAETAKHSPLAEAFFDYFQIFETELEKIGVHSNFADFCHTYQLTRGKNIEEEQSSNVGEVKVSC